MLMMMAHVAALRGTCNRLRVGAVIAVDSRPLSLGYNGTPPGHEHCGPECNAHTPCTKTLHAERNAIEWAWRHFVAHDLVGATIYVTDSPCIDCARLIVKVGIKRVVFDRPYRVADGIEHLIINGVEVVQCQVDLAINANSAPTHTTPAFKA